MTAVAGRQKRFTMRCRAIAQVILGAITGVGILVILLAVVRAIEIRESTAAQAYFCP